jgi:hypothetical protein
MVGYITNANEVIKFIDNFKDVDIIVDGRKFNVATFIIGINIEDDYFRSKIKISDSVINTIGLTEGLLNGLNFVHEIVNQILFFDFGGNRGNALSTTILKILKLDKIDQYIISNIHEVDLFNYTEGFVFYNNKVSIFNILIFGLLDKYNFKVSSFTTNFLLTQLNDSTVKPLVKWAFEFLANQISIESIVKELDELQNFLTEARLCIIIKEYILSGIRKPIALSNDVIFTWENIRIVANNTINTLNEYFKLAKDKLRKINEERNSQKYTL